MLRETELGKQVSGVSERELGSSGTRELASQNAGLGTRDSGVRAPGKPKLETRNWKLAASILAFSLYTLSFAARGAAQQPQAQAGQAIYPVNAKYVQGVGFGYWPTAGSGLTLNITAGTTNCNGTDVFYPGGSLTLTANSTNYVFLNVASSCAPASGTSSYGSGNIHIAVVVTGASSITTITDTRTPYSVLGLADPGSNSLVYRSALNTTRAATYADVTGMFGGGSCSGYLKSTGGCDTPSSMVWPSGGAGIPSYGGSQGWGTTYNASNPIPFSMFGSSNAANCFVAGPNGSVGNLACRSIVAADLPLPLTGSVIVYATPNGSDANNCVSWGTACFSIMGAYDKLPNAGGTIKFTDGGVGQSISFCKATDPAHCGIWLANSGDPNYSMIGQTENLTACTYSSPNATCAFPTGTLAAGNIVTIAGVSPSGYNGTYTAVSGGAGTVSFAISNPGGSGTGGTIQLAGWRRAKTIVTLDGESGSCFFSFVITPQVCTTGGGSSTMLPDIWLSGVSSHTFRNIALNRTSYAPLLLGVDSSGSNADVNTAAGSNRFDNVQFNPKTVAGGGPAVTVGSNSLWNFFNYDQFQGNGSEVATLSGCSRTSGTTTCTGSVALPTSWTGCLPSCSPMNLGIYGISDSSMSGIQSATVTGTTTFTFSQPNLSNSSATGGMANSDASMGLLLTGTGEGTGNLVLLNPYFSGGARIYGSGGEGNSIEALNAFSENASAPLFDFDDCPNAAYIQNPYMADTSVSGLADVNTNVLPSSCMQGPIVIGGTATGPAQLLGSTPPASGSLAANPLVQGQYGVVGNKLYGQTDDARRQFGLVTARFTNLANAQASSWPTGGGCGSLNSTTIADPLGGNNAGQMNAGSGGVNTCFAKTSLTASVGDYVIGGVWAQSVNGNGYANSDPLQLISNGTTIKWQNGSTQLLATAAIMGNGQWEWFSVVGQVMTAGTGNVEIGGYGTSSQPANWAFPVMVYIPASSGLSANEVYEFAVHLQSYRSDATVGQASLLPGVQFKADSAVIPALTGNASTASTLNGCTPSTAGTLCYWTGSAWLQVPGNTSGTQYLSESPSGIPGWGTPPGSTYSAGSGLSLNAGVFSVDCNPLNLTTVCEDEEFIGGGSNSAQIGKLGWTTASVVAGGGSVALGGGLSWPLIGSIKLQTVATSGDGISLTTPAIAALGANGNWDSDFAYQFGSASGASYRVGYGIGGNTTVVPKDGMYVRFDPNLTNITAATYTGGGSITGSATQTCNASFWGGTATATIALTGTNIIAGSTAFTMVSNGAGYNSVNPTVKATLSNGTANCSGTATVVVTNGAAASGGDTQVMACAQPSNDLYNEFCSSFGVSPDTNPHVLRIRSTAAGTLGLTLDSGSEITFCSSGCNVTLTPFNDNVAAPMFQVVSLTTSTSESLYCKFWRFKAWGLTFP